MATLDDALCNVHQLATINIPDEQPQIEAPPASITYISNFDTNFEDSKAFITCISKYLEEADVHKGLVGVTFIVDHTSEENKWVSFSRRLVHTHVVIVLLVFYSPVIHRKMNDILVVLELAGFFESKIDRE